MCVVFKQDPTHYVNCRYTAGDRLFRHNECVRIIADGVRDLSGHARVEPRKLNDNNGDRPDIDFTVGVHRVLLDFTCRNDVSRSQIGRESVLQYAERRKVQHYSDMAKAVHAQLSVFMMRAFGGFCKSSLDLVEVLRRHGVPRDSLCSSKLVLHQLCQRLSVMVHRANGNAYIKGVAKSVSPLVLGAGAV